MIYFCGLRNRRELVLASAAVNGIDYLEVVGPPGCGTQLAIMFLKDATGLALAPGNVVVSGGAPVTPVSVTPAGPQDPNLVVVTLDATGDFSPYTLTLVAAPGVADPPDGLDPVLSTLGFSFKAGCPSPADCLPAAGQRVLPPPPDINYLARDYDGFRQVMLDRLAVTTPAWTERHAADLGIVLTEALAYAADHLSYQQDAMGTEGYIGTARSRISLRRHARLVDYRIGEGCNARTLVALTTTADAVTAGQGTLFYPDTPGLPVAADADGAMAARLAGTVPVFAAMADTTLYVEQNEIQFYTWGDGDCCLPAGATQATLTPNLTSLAPGTVLVFEEVLGPATGAPGDADPAHRCAVMLTSATWTDYQGRLLTDPVTGTAVTRVSWASADALPFALCLSSTVNGAPVTGVSVARGNVVPADNGSWTTGEPLPCVPQTGRYYPHLAGSPLTFRVPYPDTVASAAAFLAPAVSLAVPVITLVDSTGVPWEPQPDLLSSGSQDTHFVPEIEYDGTVFLRFGDGQHGAAPDPGMTFTATYRVGNGSAGNVGADALGHAIFPAATLPAPPFPAFAITAVRNPLPVSSGTDPEAMDHIRQSAPFAFQTQERCVTEADYGQAAAAIAGVSQARGTLRWTGSWYTAFVSVEPAAPALTAQLTSDVSQQMGRKRMMGTDVAVEAAIIVGLRIWLTVCVDPEHFRGDVYGALMRAFTGPGGVLNAARFTFGQTVYASPLVAAAQAVEGVSSVTLNTFSRMDAPLVNAAATGYLTLGRLEIPRCDNDPDHLDHGLFTLAMDGGK